MDLYLGIHLVLCTIYKLIKEFYNIQISRLPMFV